MNYLLIENVSKSYGIRILFKDLTFGIEKGQKVSLVAKNGTGKTTLLRIIAGLDTPETGKVVTRSGITIGYLSQSPVFEPEASVIDTILSGDNPVSAAVRNYEKALAGFEASGSETEEKALTQAMQEMDRLYAWDFESRVKMVLSKLQLDNYLDKTKNLSGGQQKRLALAAVLLREPDLLVLDEPTNHLDIGMIEWLEDYLTQPNITLLMVTHDRYFLDNICSDIYEMDAGTIFQYKGNYSYFLEKKAEREANLASETDKARNLYFRELEWVRRMPKARGTKSKSRVDAFDEIKEKAFALKKQKEMDIQFRMKRMGGKILELVKVSKAFGDKVLMDQFSYSFRKGERIGIVGNNGSGKSTLLKMILGEMTPDAGKIITGDTIEFGFYRQDGMIVKQEQRVIEAIKEIAEVIDTDKSSSVTASQMLTRFDFPPEMQYNHISKLSGGEKRRLYLLTVLLRNPNFLILDEPTNDLDIITLNKLEEFLENFQGCTIIVTHDRYFMDKLVDQIFVFEGDGKVNIFPGSYTEYQLKKQEEALRLKELAPKHIPPATVKETVVPPKEKKKLSYKEKLEFEQLEKDIPILEARKKTLEQSMNEGITNHEELMKVSLEFEEVLEALQVKSDRWLELSELVG